MEWKMPDKSIFKEYPCEVCGHINNYIGKKRKCCFECMEIFDNKIDIAYWSDPKGINLKIHKTEKNRLKKIGQYDKTKSFKRQ